MSSDTPTADTVEDLESFRARAREWVRGNLRRVDGPQLGLHAGRTTEEELADVAEARALQRKFHDAGFAGITVPKEYGGLGLSREYQDALNGELIGYEYTARLQIPTINPCMAVLLDFGTHEQKLEHVPKILRGEEIWIQFLSEPSGGSDVAGALTTAVRDGDEWVLNGAKVWSSGAWWSDWALCLVRTNWDAPKHRGLTVFMLPINAEGVEVRRTEMINGSTDFCEEFLNDVRVPDTDRVGDVNDGWTVGTRWMVHERIAFNSPLCTGPRGSSHGAEGASLVGTAAEYGRLDDPVARDLIGSVRALEVAGEYLNKRIGRGAITGLGHPQAPAIGRLHSGLSQVRRRTVLFELAADEGAIWGEEHDTDPDAPLDPPGLEFLMRQVSCIGGGTTEIARNVISERILGMPREPAPDRDVNFRDVPRGTR